MAAGDGSTNVTNAVAEAFLGANVMNPRASAPLFSAWTAPPADHAWPMLGWLERAAPRDNPPPRETRARLDALDFLRELSTQQCDVCTGRGHHWRKCPTHKKITDRGKCSRIQQSMFAEAKRKAWANHGPVM